MREAWSFGGKKGRGPGSPSDDLFLEILENGLLEDGRNGNPEPTTDIENDEADVPDSSDEEFVLPDSGPGSRLKIVQRIWGKGFLKPGGEKIVADLIWPLALNGDYTVLDIGAELGGSSRTISGETGAWVSGFESNAD